MLPLAAPGTFAQVFTPDPDMSMKTTGTFTSVSVCWCHSSGAITWTVPGRNPVTGTYADGDMFGLTSPGTVVVSGGTWSFM